MNTSYLIGIKKTTLFFAFILATTCVIAQQASPIGILFNPRVNKFAVSGVGGGNVYEFTANKNSTSGQVAIDWNIALSNGYTSVRNKEKLTTLTTIFKYNPLLQANYVSGDSIELKKLAFVDNEFQFLLGLRLVSLRAMGIDNNSKFLNSFFVDGSMAPYELISSYNPLNKGFKNFNINVGYTLGYITNTDFGLIGITFSPQANFIGIYENESNGRAFEELSKSSLNLSKNILGGGGKVNVFLNDFCFFFEIRKYSPLYNSRTINGLTDRAIFSVGGVATGTVFKTKTKEVQQD